ncbi:rho GTPase-activating protein 22 isoform X8 [Pelodiscus sinensis]|uniref:rho GTPase-activating protein 22 isoform X8 n=1 Tax=Pelodiscus sinensis TaxID=13735 RepID=UPI000D72066C|nr:rho GTPase-activating protein 22 isoform X2 [Pelodiscus sinensis]|eukprot:XP_025037938.1 rho GTPase-activating protein 22 isoform X2 [Pelodiscus sinensis]
MLSPKIRQARRARSKSLVMGEHTGPAPRPASPSPQDRVLKSGWLKKQRSIMKNWQQRWFVLRGDQLFYYKDEEETKPQAARGTGKRCLSIMKPSCSWLIPRTRWKIG